jgi:hypothetical protein
MKTIKNMLIMSSTRTTTNIADRANQNTDFINMVSYAIKAPSGHNTQPWLFKLSETAIEIHPDFRYTLPVVDVNNRELYISLGCAAENLCICAAEAGYKTDFSILKDEQGIAFMSIGLEKGNAKKDPLFAQIEKRQTNKAVYKNRMIPVDTLDILKKIIRNPVVNVRYYENGTSEFNTLKDLVAQGNAIQMMDDDFKNELLSWMRFNSVQVRKNPSGISYSAMGMPAVPGFMGKPIVKSFLKPDKQNKSDKEKIDSSSYLVLFTLHQNDTDGWIILGRTLQRFLLETTRLGIASAYMNQACEVQKLATSMQSKLDLNEETPQLLLRIGYADPMPYTPRRLVEEVILKIKKSSNHYPYHHFNIGEQLMDKPDHIGSVNKIKVK